MPDFLRIKELNELPSHLYNGVIAIGNFDGLHRGHQAVLHEALSMAQKNGLPALVLTFEPHPRSVFQSEKKLARITPAPMKSKILETFGFDAVIEAPFDRNFAELSAEQFVKGILCKQFKARGIVTGFDFHFGKNRQGGPAFLMDAGKKYGFEVKLVDALRDDNADVISSSRIRQNLHKGEITKANELLGYHYRISAKVETGEQLGRTLGYPTANMTLPTETPLAYGIYAVRFHRIDGHSYNGVASFGKRPTVMQEGAALFETYIFDFKGDIYGEKCVVSLMEYLRREEKFEGLDALTAQMQIDEQQARDVLQNVTSLSFLDGQLTFEGQTD